MGNSPSSSSSYAAQQAESRKTSKDSKKSKRYGGFKKSRSSSNSSKTLPDDGYLQQENIVQVHLPRHHPHYDRVSFLNQQNRHQLDYFDRSDERSGKDAMNNIKAVVARLNDIDCLVKNRCPSAKDIA